MDNQIVGLEITTEVLTGKIDGVNANELLKKIEDKITEVIEKEFKGELHVISGKGRFMYLGDKIRLMEEIVPREDYYQILREIENR